MNIQPQHWQEWLDSSVQPDLIRSNVRSLSETDPYSYLCYSSQLERRNDGRLSNTVFRRYLHTEAGGWWCAGLDPLTQWQPMLWGCFKPDFPRSTSDQQKSIKYEHPAKISTRAFFLDVPRSIWWQVADRYQCWLPEQQELHQRALLSLSVVTAFLCTDLNLPWPGWSALPAGFLPGSTSDKAPLWREDFNFWQWVLENPQIPIILVEGAKKAGCLLSQGFVAIALPGVFNGRRVMRDPAGKIWAETLIPDLELFAVEGRSIYFCFDHDTKPQTVRNVNVAIAKTGKLLVDRGCSVQVIRLPGPEKGVDDFVVAQGSNAFELLYQAALPLNHWQWQVQKENDLTHTPWLKLNVPELLPALGGSMSSSSSLLSEGLWAIASAKGTGKTKFIAEAVANSAKVLLLTHRTCLGRSLAERMGLTWRTDADKAKGKWIANGEQTTYRLGLCVDSLLSVDPTQFQDCDLVIDEVCQVLRHLLTSDTCRKDGKRPALLSRLQLLLRIARRIIIADADLNDGVLKYIKDLRGETTQVYLIQNDYRATGYPVRFINCPNDSAITAELIAAIQAGQKVLIQTDSKEFADAIAAMLDPDIKFIKITSDTSGNPDEIDFVHTINQRVKDYQVVIATPAMATGVSIEVDHFDQVFGVFFGTVTDADAAQALGRVRENIPRTVWCITRGKNFSPIDRSSFASQIKQSLKMKWDQEVALIRASLGLPEFLTYADARFHWENNPHLDLFLTVTADANRSMWQLRDNLHARLNYEGNQVEVIHTETNKPIKTMVTEAKQQNWEDECHLRANAKILDPTERADLEGRESLSLDDKRALEKARIADFYAVAPEAITPELVAFDDKGRKRGQLAKLEMLLYPALAAKKTTEAIAKQAAWNQGLWVPDLPTAEAERMAKVLLGLVPFLVPGQEWTEEDLEPLGSMARQYAADVKRWLGFTIHPDREHANNIWIFRRMLHQLGIVTHARRKTRKQIRLVRIDETAWEEIQEILKRRLQRREMVAGQQSDLL